MLKELIRLIELKNDYLERYMISTEDFIRHMQKNNIGDVELLSNNRENILGIIAHLDEKIHKITEKLPDNPENVSSEMKTQLRSALNKKEELIQDIVQVDEILFKYLNIHKHAVADEINEVKDLKDAIGGYAAASQK